MTMTGDYPMNDRTLQQTPSGLKHKRRNYHQPFSRKPVYNQIKKNVISGQGILCLSGETGIGKSFLLQELIAELTGDITFITLPTKDQTFQSIISELCEELGLSSGKEIILVALQSINNHLAKQQKPDSRIVVIFDDAQQLSPSVIEKLMLLSSPPSYKSASMQLIFCGIPNIEDVVNQAKQSRLQHSRFYCYRLEKLNSSETFEFIKHILSEGDFDYIDLFTPAAISNIVDFSSGIPRRIKTICDMALFAIGAPEAPKITEKLVSYVVKELMLVPVDMPEHPLAEDFQDITMNLDDPELDPVTNNTEAYANIITADDKDLVEPSTLPPDLRSEPSHQSELQPNDTIDTTDTEMDDNKIQLTDDSQPTLPLSWGIAALVVLGAIIFALRPPAAPSGENRTIVKQVKQQLDNHTSQIKFKNKASVASPPVASAQPPKPDPELSSPQSKTNKPGDIARAFIANLERSDQNIDLDMLYNRAETLRKQNNQVDAYLLDFYAAKHGHAKAAFRLGQMADPATFSEIPNILKKASISQAYKWYLLAAQAGHKEAARHLKKMQTSVLAKAAAGDETWQRLALQFQNSIL